MKYGRLLLSADLAQSILSSLPESRGIRRDTVAASRDLFYHTLVGNQACQVLGKLHWRCLHQFKYGLQGEKGLVMRVITDVCRTARKAIKAA